MTCENMFTKLFLLLLILKAVTPCRNTLPHRENHFDDALVSLTARVLKKSQIHTEIAQLSQNISDHQC